MTCFVLVVMSVPLSRAYMDLSAWMTSPLHTCGDGGIL